MTKWDEEYTEVNESYINAMLKIKALFQKSLS